ncbi:hypothetical protein K438DRAFT_1976487 [Mycena galopus ATCC 62051]|nr:hypothetical protein K438DRAFT_1976487 [Mycena galopus ATCC 62051]
MGRHEDAVPKVAEAVGRFRKLAETNPGPVIMHGLATSLYSLGAHLRAVGRNTDALQVGQEAVDLRRTLAEVGPAATWDLAQSLHALGIHLNDAGRGADALCAYEEVVQLLCKNAAQDLSATKLHALSMASSPSADISSSLDVLSAHLHKLGDRGEDALLVCEEAIKLYRNLPKATDPILALRLTASAENLGVFLRALAGTEIHPDLTTLGTRSRKNLLIRLCAHSPENPAFSPSNVGRAEDAAQAAAQPADLHRSTGDDEPEGKAGLATVLCSLAVFLHKLNHDEDASHAEKNEAESFRKLAATDLELTARSLHSLARDLRSIGLHEDALRAQGESANHYRTSTQTRPALLRLHIRSLPVLAKDLHFLGRTEDAAHTEAEVADLEGLHSL